MSLSTSGIWSALSGCRKTSIFLPSLELLLGLLVPIFSYVIKEEYKDAFIVPEAHILQCFVVLIICPT